MIISFKGNTGGGGYVLPTATDSRLGGIKVGSGLTIDSGGTLSTSGGTGVSDYNDLTGKPVVNGFELSGSTFPIWAGRDLKECFGLMDGQPYYGMPSYVGHKVFVPEGEVETGSYTGYTVEIDYTVPYDGETHYQDCGTITSVKNGTTRTISFQVYFSGDEDWWHLQYKSDSAETWTDVESVSADTMGWRHIYKGSWGSSAYQYDSYLRVSGDSYTGRVIFQFVPSNSNWDIRYATWTLPETAVYTDLKTGIKRTQWRESKIYVKYDSNANFIEGCYDTEKYYIFVTSAGTVTSSTLTNYEKLEGYQDISGHTTFYDSETKHKWAIGVIDDNSKVYSTANAIFYCDFNGGYQTNTPSLEGYVNVNVNGTMTTYHGKWQKQSYGSWQTLLWEPYSPVQASGVANIWKGTQAEYDAITAKSDTTLYVIVPATGQPANEIWYTHTGETIITPSVSESGFNPTLGNSIVSNIYSNGMGKMVFANPITVIPDNAFDSAMSDDESFPTISFPEGVTTLGSNILRYCHMAGVSIPSTVTTLSSQTFNNMYSASEDSGATIVIPSGVTVIPQECFSYTQAASITLPSTITEIGGWGFYEVWTADGSITFEGTSTQWTDDITFGENWMGGETNLCEIRCSDSTSIDYCS